MQDFSDRACGYRGDLENFVSLASKAQPREQYAFGAVDPTQLGKPMGMIDVLKVEDQQQISSCAGNSSTTILECCLWHLGGMKVQLSRMFAYVNGQRHCGITGDNGATLEGVIAGFRAEGCPEEQWMPYTGSYFNHIPADAVTNAVKYKLKSFSPVNSVMDIYEGLAGKIGGVFIGIPCTQEIFQADSTGILDYYSGARAGGHAMAFVDWCEEKDSKGYPYLLLANSWGARYGYRGYRKVKPSVAQAMLQAAGGSFYLLSDMNFIKPRYDWTSNKWLG